jgi:hypothetical protein
MSAVLKSKLNEMNAVGLPQEFRIRFWRFLMAIQQRLAPIAAFLILALILFWGSWREHDLFRAWAWLGVPAMPPPRLPFADTISVTHSIDCLRAGFDPYVTGRCDPWGRLFNYPPVWLQLARLPISGASTWSLGVCLAALTCFASIVAFKTSSPQGFIVIVLALLSPSFVFGIERGNVDTLLFSMLVLGLFWTRKRRPSTKRYLRTAMIVVLSILKIYPVAAAVLFLNQRKGGWFWLFGICVSAGIAVACSSSDRLTSILDNTPLTSFYSFGAAPLFLDLRGISDYQIDAAVLRLLASGLALVVGVGFFGAAAASARCGGVRWPLPTLSQDFNDELCLACLGIFCFTFLLGSNFNYRLIFVAGVLPKLIASFDAERRATALIRCAILLALLWASYLPAAANNLLQWCVYMGACAWLGHAAAENKPWRISWTRSQGEGRAEP